MKTLVVLLVLILGLGAVADRVAVNVAEDQVASQLQTKGDLKGAPSVDITGFPFLTQAVAGRYDAVHIGLTAAELGQPEGTKADVVLRGVQVPLSSVVSGSVSRVPVDRIEGTVTLSYALLSAKLGSDTRLTRDGDGLRITRTVELLGQRLPLTATGQVRFEGSDVVVRVQRATGVGVAVPSWLLRQAAGLLNLRYTVPKLPFGLTLTSVTPAAGGLNVGIAAKNTVLGG